MPPPSFFNFFNPPFCQKPLILFEKTLLFPNLHFKKAIGEETLGLAPIFLKSELIRPY